VKAVKSSYLSEPLRAPVRRDKKKAPAQVDIASMLEKAITEVVAKVENDIRESVNVTVSAPEVSLPEIPIPDVSGIIADTSKRLSAELVAAFNTSVADIRSDISNIKMPKPDIVTAWGFNDFEYDEDGRLISFRANAE